MTAARSTLMPGFDGPELPAWLADRLRAGLAGVCLFGQNVRSRTQVRELVAAVREANPMAVVAIDEEGGDVTRLFYDIGSPYPGNAVLGRLDDEALSEHVGRTVGWELRRAGIDLDLAPDADVNSTPLNPVIGTRSFGADAGLVARHTVAWVRGLQSTGVAASAKHFPGHGDTVQDSHLALPVVHGGLEQLRARELAPFAAAVRAGVRTIMSSHILLPDVDPDQPATFSPRILQELLRGELGFEGVIVSDALDMAGASGRIGIPAAAARALAGGCDLLCIGTDNTERQLERIERAIERAVDRGELAQERLADAGRRVAGLARESARLAASIPIPDEHASDAEPAVDAARLRTAIDATPGLRIRADRQLFALQSEANIAVGLSPWGPEAAGAAVERVTPPARIRVRPGAQPVLVGQGIHRHAALQRMVADVRARHADAVVVEMGWPDVDGAGVDIVTWGASRAMGSALLDWLAERAEEGES